MPAQSRAYHDTGVSGALPKKHYVGRNVGGVGKRPTVRLRERDPPERDPIDDSDDESRGLSFVEEFFAFVEDEFWLFFFAMVYAFTLIAFLIAVASKYRGSRHKLWTKIIWAFIPWTVCTTMYLIDPRIESWKVEKLKKTYFRYLELQHKPKELAEAAEKWWKWRREYKPPRVFGV